MKTGTPTSKPKASVDAKPKEIIPTKVVVRGLPPTLTAELFLEEVSPLADHNYFNFVPADRSLGQFAFCKAFINFKNAEDLFLFRERFDNYVFVDTRGNEYPAVVEFAPYQKIPLRSRKPDHRENTLDDDADYKKFLEQLENPEAAPSFTIKEVLEEVDTKAKERVAAHNSETPLLAFINKFRIEKRRAQEKLREERRLKELERKRIRDEERRMRRDRERKEAGDREKRDPADISKHKDERRSDLKKPSTSKSGKPAGSKATSDQKPSSANKSATDKSKYSGSANQKRNDDDIIVRTLPSAKSKASKLAAEKSRPSSSKSHPLPKNSHTPQKPTSAPPQKEGDKKEILTPQKVLSGKQEVALKENGKQTDKSGKHPTKPTPSASTSAKTKEQTVKITHKKTQEGASSVNELTDRTAKLKLKDRTKSQDSCESTSSSESNRSNKNNERSIADESSTACDTKSENTHSSEAPRGDRPRPPRNTRYKDRPERAIYNPAAKAAERRQRQQHTTPDKSSKPE